MVDLNYEQRKKVLFHPPTLGIRINKSPDAPFVHPGTCGHAVEGSCPRKLRTRIIARRNSVSCSCCCRCHHHCRHHCRRRCHRHPRRRSRCKTPAMQAAAATGARPPMMMADFVVIIVVMVHATLMRTTKRRHRHFAMAMTMTTTTTSWSWSWSLLDPPHNGNGAEGMEQQWPRCQQWPTTPSQSLPGLRRHYRSAGAVETDARRGTLVGRD